VQQHGVRPFALQNGVDASDHEPDGLGRRLASRLEEVIRPPYPEVGKEELVQLVVIVLPGVDDDQLVVSLDLLENATELDDLRTRADDGHDLHRMPPGAVPISASFNVSDTYRICSSVSPTHVGRQRPRVKQAIECSKSWSS